MKSRYDNLIYDKSTEVYLNEALFKKKTKEKEPNIKIEDELVKVIYSAKSVISDAMVAIMQRYKRYFKLLTTSEIAEDYANFRYVNRFCIGKGQLDDDIAQEEVDELEKELVKAVTVINKKIEKGYKVEYKQFGNKEYRLYVITPNDMSSYVQESAYFNLQKIAEYACSMLPNRGYVRPMDIEEMKVQLEMTDTTDMIEIGSYNATKYSKYINEKEVYVEFAEEMEKIFESINEVLPEGYIVDVEGSWDNGNIVVKEGLIGFNKKSENNESNVEEGAIKDLTIKAKEKFAKFKEKVKEKFTKEGRRKAIEKKEFEDEYKSDMVSLAKHLRSMLPEDYKADDEELNEDIKSLATNKMITFGKYDFRKYSEQNPESSFDHFLDNLYSYLDKCYSLPDVKEGPYEIEVYGGKVDGTIALIFKAYTEFIDADEDEESIQESLLKELINTTKNYYKNRKEARKRKKQEDKNPRVTISKEEFKEKYLDDFISTARKLMNSLPKEGFVSKYNASDFESELEEIENNRSISIGYYDVTEYSTDNFRDEEVLKKFYKLVDDKVNSMNSQLTGPYTIVWDGDWDDGVLTLHFDADKVIEEPVDKSDEDDSIQEGLVKELINTSKTYFKNRIEARKIKHRRGTVSDEEFKEKYFDELISTARKLCNSLPKDGYICKNLDFESDIEDAENGRYIVIGHYDIMDYDDKNYKDDAVLQKFYTLIDNKLNSLNSQVSGPFIVVWDGDWDDGNISLDFDVTKIPKESKSKTVKESADTDETNTDISNELYDFGGFILAVTDIIQSGVEGAADLRAELNRFFDDSKCTNVLVTDNTDGSFFGVYVQPFISINTIDSIIYNDNNEIDNIKEYRVEIDSKLLNLTGPLSIDEITAIIINEVAGVVGSNKPLTQISNAYQVAQANLFTEVPISTSTSYLAPIHRFAICRSVRELTSIFTIRDEEYIADEMAVKYGYNASLESAFNKLKSSSYITIDHTCPLTLIKWACTVADEITNKQRGVLNMIDDAMTISGSELEKEEFNELAETIKRQNKFVSESFGETRRKMLTEGFFKKAKLRGLRSVEDDLYEYKVRSTNIETESDALMTLRGINYRINMLEDYLISKSVDGYDKERCQELISKFKKLRDELMEKPAYKNKYIGLFVDAPVHRGQLIF